MMRILWAGGVPVYADNFASFEHGDLEGPQDMRAILPRLYGKAAKVLDPQRNTWPDRLDAKVILLDRTPREQAKSQIKFLREISVLDINRQAWRPIERSLMIDRTKVRILFAELEADVLPVRFELLIEHPNDVIGRVSEFLRMPFAVDDLSSIVVKRSPSCAPNCAIELAALARTA